jgi:hypothetical protein
MKPSEEVIAATELHDWDQPGVPTERRARHQPGSTPETNPYQMTRRRKGVLMQHDSNSLEQRLARLAAEADHDRISFSSDWDRTTEPRLAGVLESVREVQTRYGQKRIARIRRLDGTFADVWLSPTKLRDEWEREQPQTGELLLISFHGDIPMPTGNPKADIRVRVDRTDQGQAPLAVAV